MELTLLHRRQEVGKLTLTSPPRVEQLVTTESGKTYRITDHTWESMGLGPYSRDEPTHIGVASVEPPDSNEEQDVAETFSDPEPGRCRLCGVDTPSPAYELCADCERIVAGDDDEDIDE